MRTYKAEELPDYVCEECTQSQSALYCEKCKTWTCRHYSLWGSDDALGPEGEQLVHRCNDCEQELVEPGETTF